MTSPSKPFITIGLLAISIALLSSLIPGGPIEHRDFGHLGVTTVLSFNIFLAGLILTSAVALVLIWKGSRFGGALAFHCGVGFAGVYLLDLFEIFPTSPTTMSDVLFYVEAVGLITAGLLMAVSHTLTIDGLGARASSDQRRSFSPPLPMVFFILTVSVGTIAFATVSALGL